VARDRWVQVHADLGIGAYTYSVLDDTDEPEWPDLTWPAIKELAFRAQIIKAADHPVLEQVLRGK
jgi:hypothetical protein